MDPVYAAHDIFFLSSLRMYEAEFVLHDKCRSKEEAGNTG